MARLPNYVVDENPFHLGGPPDYWLRALWEFDNSLVIMPSKQGFYYRVCQKRPPNYAVTLVNDIMKENADSRMIAAKNLIPVTTLLATANWSEYPKHLEAMRQRAPWRNGGAEKFAKQVEQAEWEAEQKRRASFDQEVLTPLAKDAWGMYNKKIGVRSHMYIPKTGSTPVSTQLKVKEKKEPGIKVGSIFLP